MIKFVIRGYQLCISPFIASRCRFYPSCSHYALEALEKHGALRGSWMSIKRLLRCHPFNEGGFDPVPDSAITGNTKQSQIHNGAHDHCDHQHELSTSGANTHTTVDHTH
jgi:putative membrane protein insertion efficiency factor